MLNLRRNYVSTPADLRENPRIELHLPATIIGIDAKANIVDFSMGGFYIEMDASKIPNSGQRLNIALKLPNENIGVTVKAEVVYCTANGFGCKLCDPNSQTLQILKQCFNLFCDTLPVSISSDADHGICMA